MCIVEEVTQTQDEHASNAKKEPARWIWTHDLFSVDVTNYRVNTKEMSGWAATHQDHLHLLLTRASLMLPKRLMCLPLRVALPCPCVPVSPHWANPHRPNPTAGQACIESVLLGAICHLPCWAMPALWGLRGPLRRLVRIKTETYASSKWLRAGSPVTMTCCWMPYKQPFSRWDFREPAHGRHCTARGKKILGLASAL